MANLEATLLSHPTGNQNVRHVLAGLQSHGGLDLYVTTLGISREDHIVRWVPESLRSELDRRSYALCKSVLQTFPTKEIFRLVLGRLARFRGMERLSRLVNIDDVYIDLDRRTAVLIRHRESATGNPKVLYAYEDGAEFSFRIAKELGMTRIYDLPIAYWETSERLQSEEAVRLPSWATTLGDGRSFPDWKRRRKTVELEMAELVLCPSEFVKRSLPAWASEKHCRVIPFGSPPPHSPEEIKVAERERAERREQGKPLRVLFCGSMSQRKGLGDLFQAMKSLDQTKVGLVILGSLQAPMEFYREEYSGFIHEVVRPHAEVLKLMRSCDVFCLPSIVEGRALVMQEAMSQGLPLIITPNTGGEDLIREGETGFLVPIRSPEMIAEKIQWFMDHRDQLPVMSRAAIAHAASYTWGEYADRVVEAIRETCEEPRIETLSNSGL